MAGQVVAVASGKGGVGKTTTVSNLGVVLRRSNHSVALVDADLGMANLGPMLGISGDPTLHDVLAGTAELDDALVTETAGFSVLPGSETLTDFSDADPRGLRAVVDALAADYDYVLVDTGAGMTHEGVLPLGLADRVVLVTSPDPAAVENTRKTAELTELADGVIAGVIVTKADESVDPEEVAATVGVDLLGVIPFDATVRRSTAAGKPLEAVDPDSPAARAYREVAEVLTSKPTGSREPTEEAAAAPSGPDDRPDEPDEAAGTDDSESSAGATSAEEAAEGETAAAEADPDAPETADSDDPVAERTEAAAEPGEPEPEATAPDEPSGAGSDTPAEPSGDTEVDSTGSAENGSEEGPADETSATAPDEPAASPDHEDSESRGGFLGWLGRLFQ